MQTILPPAPRRLILLVDDDVLILGLLSTCLECAGYEVRIATTGAMALDLIRDGIRAPDLALLDIAMPGMSGLDLADRLVTETNIPFMVLSAHDDQESIRRASERGALGYLVKPIEVAGIAPAIQAALARADEIRQLRKSEAHLVAALQTGRETGMAVGMLMERYKSDRDTAFRVLREFARAHHRKLNDVAIDLLDKAEAMNAFGERFPGLGRRNA